MQGEGFEGFSDACKRARHLIGTFSSSNQLSENLRKVQLNNDVRRPLKFIQDVVTRWWSTYCMIERFLDLLPYVDMLHLRGAVSEGEMLSASDIIYLRVLKRVLKPFMIAQKVLEGQKYVTNSLLPYIIHTVREEIKESIASSEGQSTSDFMEKLLSHRTKGFNTYWGSGAPGTVFLENETLGYISRQKGLPKKTLMASFLDPRTKDLSTMDPEDSRPLLEYIRNEMLKDEKELQPMAHVIVPAVAAPEVVQASEDTEQNNKLTFFNNLRRPRAQIIHAVPVAVDQRMLERIDQEINNYQLNFPSIPIQECDDVKNWTCTNPLSWWKTHERDLPILSRLARRTLCIPATSAPSERVFSMAGLTVSNLRASLSSDNASSLIFLHDVWNIAEDFQSKRAQLHGGHHGQFVF